MGKDIRRISGSIKKVEDTLNAQIGQGTYTKLAFGKKAKYKSSKEDLLHYIVRQMLLKHLRIKQTKEVSWRPLLTD